MQISLQLTSSKNRLALLTLIFILPFFAFIGYMTVLQLFHMQAGLYSFNHLIENHIHWFNVMIGVLPLLAILINLAALIFYAYQDHSYKTATTVFVKDNFLSVASLALALLIVVFIAGHDAIPCTMHHLFSDGWRAPFQTFGWCMRNS